MSEQHFKETLQEFKTFINKHPKLLEKVRRNGHSWQEYYEKWVLLGEEDPYWQDFGNSGYDGNKSEQSTNELFNQFTQLVDKVNVPKVQKQIGELNNVITVVDELLTKYLDSRGQTNSSKHHFNRYRD